MTWAWTIPLAGGIVTCLAGKIGERESRIALNAWNSGLAALTLGAILRGVMEIAGTESALIPIFWVLGSVFLVSAPVLCLMTARPAESEKKSSQ